MDIVNKSTGQSEKQKTPIKQPLSGPLKTDCIIEVVEQLNFEMSNFLLQGLRIVVYISRLCYILGCSLEVSFVISGLRFP